MDWNAAYTTTYHFGSIFPIRIDYHLPLSVRHIYTRDLAGVIPLSCFNYGHSSPFRSLLTPVFVFIFDLVATSHLIYIVCISMIACSQLHSFDREHHHPSSVIITNLQESLLQIPTALRLLSP